jgi:hypothetical protein
MKDDHIIEELHNYREKVVEDCKAKGVTLSTYFKSKKLPKGFKYAEDKPVKLDSSRLKA